MICRKDSFEKVTQFSQVNKVVDAPDSNVDSCLWKVACVSSILLNRPIENKESLSPP
jgi:hypothetical protein